MKDLRGDVELIFSWYLNPCFMGTMEWSSRKRKTSLRATECS